MSLIKDYRWTIALGLLALAVGLNAIFSDRPLGFYNMARIAPIATLPDTPELAEVRRDTELGSGFIEHLRPSIEPLDRRSEPLRLGWVYKEAGFFGMPLYAENISVGPTLYIDTGDGYTISGVRLSAVDVIERAVGWAAATEYEFAWYWHVWGLLFPPLLIFLLWRWRKERHARDEREWTMAEAEA